MGNDVFICCAKENEDVGEEIYRVFEKNNITSWIKSKHMSSTDGVDKITAAIEDSKCFLLVLSNHAKNTNFVITEVDIAFSREIPIIVYNIDDSRIDGNLEFILENQTVINSFPNSKKQLEKLVKKTSETIGRPADKVYLDSGSVSAFERINPKKTQNKIKKYITIAIPIVIVLILIYLFVILPMGQNTTADGVFSMNITDVEVDGFNYIVHGESFNLPSDPTKYFMNIKFFDAEDNMLFEVNSSADEFKSGIMWQGELPANNATHVGFLLTDLNGNVFSKQDYVI
ncbi:MAG: toll/interleukin-1 receptor domain-containing protein [Methanobrevibacter sp.]|nr:toll/interleukin-1 receptor domain-containing protein [Methanobrevibacter sp.]